MRKKKREGIEQKTKTNIYSIKYYFVNFFSFKKKTPEKNNWIIKNYFNLVRKRILGKILKFFT